MPDRVSSDHDTVCAYRATVARSGGTRRPSLRVEGGVDALADGDLVRLVLDGTSYHAKVTVDASGVLLRGAYDNRRLARRDGDDDGRRAENRLVEWVERHDVALGRAVAFDEVDAGYHYGVREPGRRVVYEVTGRPNDSLASIAERLDGDGGGRGE